MNEQPSDRAPGTESADAGSAAEMRPIDVSQIDRPAVGPPVTDETVTITPLDAGGAPLFGAMTFDAYRRLLTLETLPRAPEEGDLRLVEPVALTARVGGRPAGLVLGEWPASEPSAEERAAFGDAVPRLLSLYVAAPFRRRGLAGRLLAAFEGEIARRGGGRVEAVYTTGKPPIAWLERLVARRGWTAPAGRSLLVRFTPRAAFDSDLLTERRLRAQRRGLEILPWRELGDGERAELVRSQEEQGWIAPLLVPWRYEHRHDPSSVFARDRDGRVVGWVITHRPEPGVVRFTCSFMHPELSRRGRILPLYDAVLRRVEDSCRECSFITPFDYAPMVSFIRRRLAPISHVVAETRIVTKLVGDRPEPRRSFSRP